MFNNKSKYVCWAKYLYMPGTLLNNVKINMGVYKNICLLYTNINIYQQIWLDN